MSCPAVAWKETGILGASIHGALIVSWIALFYSISLTGFGYQTGWTPWWAWYRGQKLASRPFVSHGAYRFFRHPIYLSFMGLIWSNPSMTVDRFLLAVVWTIYIFIGSELKDRRLEYYIGDAYRTYRKNVPAYPWNANLPSIALTLFRSLFQHHKLRLKDKII
jgi:protein-S-isoprenylcysteine O-methyltransferase Ste14